RSPSIEPASTGSGVAVHGADAATDARVAPALTSERAAAPTTAVGTRPVGLLDHVAGLGLAVAYVGALLRTVGTLGDARDEGCYYRAAQSYASWFETLLRDPRTAFTQNAVDAAWGANHEHPALIKSLFALSWMFLHNRLHLLVDEGTSLRFPAMCLAGAGVWLLYIWGSRARSRAAGLAAALAFALMPRVFYHAHLVCSDIPSATMWALAAYAFWRSLGTRGVGWPLLTGVLFGLALETKHNSWFLPFVFVGHTLLTQGARIARD